MYKSVNGRKPAKYSLTFEDRNLFGKADSSDDSFQELLEESNKAKQYLKEQKP